VNKEVSLRPHTAVLLNRRFAAPRALVFRAWTDPAMLANWWGPKMFTNPVCRVDARPGGALYIVMRAPDGGDYPMSGLFHQVEHGRRLVFTDKAVTTEGELQLEGVSIIDFADDGDGTAVTVWSSAIGFVEEAPSMLAGMNEGWSQSLDRLGELLAN
jgi:uncharacterized protein YndB with AHSA1/START domain